MRKKQEIIGLIGVIGGGKDFAAQMYVDQGYHHGKHAEGLREITEKCLGVDLKNLYEQFKMETIPHFNGYKFVDALHNYLQENTGNECLSKTLKLVDLIFNLSISSDFPAFSRFLDNEHSFNTTGREFLQYLGNFAREVFNENIWISLLYTRIKSYDKVVLSDVRYKNEAQAVLDKGGKLILCNYTDNPRYNPSDSHASEKMAQQILALGIKQHWTEINADTINSLPD